MKAPRTLALLIVAAAVAAGCGESDRPAATVDGTEVPQQQVVDELEAIRDNPGYLEAIQQEVQSPVLGTAEDAFDAAFVAQVLSQQIRYAMIANEVERRGLEADAACRDTVRADLVERLAGVTPDGDGETVLSAFPAGYREQLLKWDTDVRLLQSDLAEVSCIEADAVDAYYAERQGEFEQLCLSHILVATEEDAIDVQAELDGGADFAALAQTRSLDTQTGAIGGDLGCVLSGQLPRDIRDLLAEVPVGDTSASVPTQAGLSVILVRSRDVPELSEIRDDVEQAVSSEIALRFRDWLFEAIEVVDVQVDPRYGVWDPQTGEVERNPASSATLPTAPDPGSSSTSTP